MIHFGSSSSEVSMIRPPTSLSIALGLFLSLFFFACGSDSTGPGGSGSRAADFSGIWDVEGEVIAKRTCDREIGDLINWEVRITQDGSQATISFGGTAHELTVDGSTATAKWSEESEIDVALTIDGGELKGTVTASRGATPTPCTEVFSLSGTRSNETASGEFSGAWDFSMTFGSLGCQGEPAGSTEDICRRIRVVNSTVILEDPDGDIVGVGDGNTAVLERFVEGDEYLKLTVTISPNGISGEFYSNDYVNPCSAFGSIVGTKRSTPCPPPPAPGELAGSWFVDPSVWSSTVCPLGDVKDYIGECMSVSIDGSSVSIDDGSPFGLLSGTIDGDIADLTRTEPDGQYSLHLELDGDVLLGTVTKNIISGGCTGSVIEVEFDGTRLPLSCAASGGPFDGSWSVSFAYLENGCQFPPPGVDCWEIFQSGNLAFLDGGAPGTVSGNTFTVTEVTEDAELDLRITLETVLQVDGNGTTLTGTQTLTIGSLVNPQDSCTVVASVNGTPTTSCAQDSARQPASGMMRFGAALLGAP
jgi:hypothetical protein